MGVSKWILWSLGNILSSRIGKTVIQMIKVMTGRCEQCSQAAEYNFSKFGAEEDCIKCGAAPISIRSEK